MKKYILGLILCCVGLYADVFIAQTNTAQMAVIFGTNYFAGYASNADASGVTNYYHTNGGADVIINTNTSSWSLSFNTHTLGNGTNVITFVTLSADGATSNTYAQTNIVDNSVPTVGITNVATNSYTKGTFVFLGTNSEDWSTVVGVKFYISNDSDTVWTNDGTVALTAVSFSTNTANFDDGIYYVYAVVTNNKGLSGSSAIFRFHMINDLPLLAMTNGPAHLSTNAGTNAYKGYASNVFPSIDPPLFYYQTNSGTLVAVAVTNLYWELNINSHLLRDGTNTYTFYAVTSNYVTNSITYTNIVDNRAPAFGITNLAAGQTFTNLLSYTFRGTNWDTWPSITTTRLIISNHFDDILTNAAVTTTANAWSFTLDLNSGVYPYGEYYLYMVTTNSLGAGTYGNAEIATINFKVALDAPSVVTTGAYPLNMGSTRQANEAPVHAVYVHAISMGTTEVTYKQWLDVYVWATNNGYTFDSAGQMGGDRVFSLADHTNTEPVTEVSWYDALKYCNALSEIQGLTPCYYTNGISASHVLRTGTPIISNSYVLFTNNGTSTTNGWRLPTEAEWEQAYYYTATTTYFWGNGDGGNYQWSRGNSLIKTKAVATKLSNSYAIFDMSGNVWEWTHDWYSNYYAVAPTVSPKGPTTGTYRTVRGGSFKDTQANNTGTRRYYFLPTDERYYVGFRVCKTQ